MINLSENEIWKIKDEIKNNKITFNIGDEVILYNKKSNGYPKGLIIGESYLVENVKEIDKIIISSKNGYIQSRKVCNKYFINKQILRNIKIDQLLD